MQPGFVPFFRRQVRKACGFKAIDDMLTNLFGVFNVFQEVAVLHHALRAEGVGGGSHADDQIVIVQNEFLFALEGDVRHILASDLLIFGASFFRMMRRIGSVMLRASTVPTVTLGSNGVKTK